MYEKTLNKKPKKNYAGGYAPSGPAQPSADMQIDSVPKMMVSKPDPYDNYAPDGMKGYGGSDYVSKEYKDVMDMEINQGHRRAFTRDDFMMMINDTYNEFFGKFRDQFNPDEYLQCVDDEELVKRLGPFLEYSDDNILTTNSMPWLDLGSIPSTHSFMRSESQQAYYKPSNRNPDMVYVHYSWLLPKYYSWNSKQLFDSSNLKHREVTFRDFEQTLNLCTMLMKNTRGKILLYDWIGFSVITMGMIIIILLGVATANKKEIDAEGNEKYSGSWGNMVLYLLLYCIFVPIIYKVSKCFQDKYMR